MKRWNSSVVTSCGAETGVDGERQRGRAKQQCGQSGTENEAHGEYLLVAESIRAVAGRRSPAPEAAVRRPLGSSRPQARGGQTGTLPAIVAPTDPAALGIIVRERAVLRPAIVPKRPGRPHPTPSHLELGLRHVIVQHVQHRLALGGRHPLDLRRKVGLTNSARRPLAGIGARHRVGHRRVGRIDRDATVVHPGRVEALRGKVLCERMIARKVARTPSAAPSNAS